MRLGRRLIFFEHFFLSYLNFWSKACAIFIIKEWVDGQISMKNKPIAYEFLLSILRLPPLSHWMKNKNEFLSEDEKLRHFWKMGMDSKRYTKYARGRDCHTGWSYVAILLAHSNREREEGALEQSAFSINWPWLVASSWTLLLLEWAKELCALSSWIVLCVGSTEAEQSQH